jgi:glycerophosphoryl diester phosphodiesterase
LSDPTIEFDGGIKMTSNITSRRLWVVAHRGGCALRPENTLAAFWNAIVLGADMVEADVKWTKDQELVLFHADTLETTTDGRGQINEFTLKELRQFDAGSRFDPRYHKETIPTLEELLRLAHNRIKVLLDLKANEVYQHQIIELVTAYKMELDVVMGVRSLDALREIKETNPAIRILSFGYPMEMAFELLEAGADIIRLWGTWVDTDVVERAQRMGKEVWVMVGGPAVEEVGRTTTEALSWYKRIGVNGVLLDDFPMAVKVNEE